ncbi:MAG: 3-oxoacyl-ACP reductase FabG [Deltaproteobacteria bacterium]|nr:3-oxoacyl-ACP reductase FabG [Deltaproteobacteria bacterium]MBW2066727.1 3-oxoacyl-ACP reductase FabG [Deltaproteobacteria bacterium]
MDVPSFELTGRVAIVTGGGTGIGKAIAFGLAGAGASVVICGRRFKTCESTLRQIQEKTGAKGMAYQCNISKKTDVETMVNDVFGSLGRIDILVNNAGVTSDYPFLELPEEEWDRVISINLKGSFLCSQAVGRIMARSKQGVIVNIGSQLGEVARPNKAHYVSSKGGVKMLTKALAVELAPYGIRVNNVAPGPVDTDLAAPVLSDPRLRSEVIGRLPIGRIGKPSEIVGAVIFLASDAASFITGVTLYVDGGYVAI